MEHDRSTGATRAAHFPGEVSERTLPDVHMLRQWAAELGFARFGVADTIGFDEVDGLNAWLDQGHHGEMRWMARDPHRRGRPDAVLPGTLSAIMVGIDYAPGAPDWRARELQRLAEPGAAAVSIYARGRDYHKLVRRRLQRLAERIDAAIGPFGYRAFCDSGPVMEVALAERAGLGWRGKHTLLLDRRGSTFFIGTLLTDLPLVPAAAGAATPNVSEVDERARTEVASGRCGTCRSCLDACPTGAIVAPWRLDARRCISYLTIELEGPIPPPLRPLVGNRVYGCDDCQLVCPWNRFAQRGVEPDFEARHGLDAAGLLELFAWSESDFDRRLLGSAIRRIGYQRWSRNLAVAIGNLARTEASAELIAQAKAALLARRMSCSALVAEHIDWALAELDAFKGSVRSARADRTTPGNNPT